jgi:hypothetical protein
MARLHGHLRPFTVEERIGKQNYIPKLPSNVRMKGCGTLTTYVHALQLRYDYMST